MRVLVAVEPVDFRRGIDGLVSLCREELRCDPFFQNRVCVPQLRQPPFAYC